MTTAMTIVMTTVPALLIGYVVGVLAGCVYERLRGRGEIEPVPSMIAWSVVLSVCLVVVLVFVQMVMLLRAAHV